MSNSVQYDSPILSWWSARLASEDSASKALAARLRRTLEVSEVLSEEAVVELGRRLNLYSSPRRLACLAHILATVKENTKTPIAVLFGRGDPPALSELRFQRMISVHDDDQNLGTALRRALPLINNACNVSFLGYDICNWNDDVTRRWCFQYFGAKSEQGEES